MPENATDSPAPAAPADPVAVDAPSLAEEIAELRAARAERDALKAKLSDEKRADRDAKKRAQEEAEKAGELAKALDAAKARLAELEGVEPLANRWREHEAAEVSRLDRRAADLPPEFTDLYKSAGDVEAKAKVLAAYDAVKGKPAKTVATPPALGAPAATAIDFTAAFASESTWVDAKAKDPQGAFAWLRSKMSPTRAGQPSTLQRA